MQITGAQYGMGHAAKQEAYRRVAMKTADDLNNKIRASALAVMQGSGFFPGSMTEEEMEESDEFHEICLDLGHEFLLGFKDNFMVPFEYD